MLLSLFGERSSLHPILRSTMFLFIHMGNQITEWLKNCFPDMYMFKIAYLIVNVNSQNTQILFTDYVPYIISFLSHLYSCISNDIPTRPWKRLFFLPIQSSTRIGPHSISTSSSPCTIHSAFYFFHFRYKLYAVILKILCELLKLSVSTQFCFIFSSISSSHP